MKKKQINQYHILNGDALKGRFPKQIDGEIIVARECFVDGDISANTLNELFEVRAKFVTVLYGGSYSKKDYYADSVSEFQKIQNIPNKSEINLWFEDDLFCQVNFWFSINLILNNVKDCNVFLIRPATHTPYGFGGLNESELLTAYQQKIPVNEFDQIAHLWNSYQKNDTEELIKTAKELKSNYPFIYNAVEAHIARIPTENYPGRPSQTLLDIINELGTESFGPVFVEFNKRESIYGFGDLQVKRLFDDIKNNH
ncbi:DUF1835 domain-containing protein [Winogradskyella sp.]|uniref:DUF1835 domain-containing protein n=1 Tax=Winogradskyella sp. TaxID=1883156 RepID=UPI00261B0186|nr:DUF1835 domain-containing protein [Winogradskyella sp.]